MISISKPKLNPHPWCIVRQLPDMQRAIVARFHRRNDAEGYRQIWRQLLPTVNHAIVFDAPRVEKLGGSQVSQLEQLF
jgi:hypothetical protein